MMKGRRILAVVLALVMTASLGLVSTVYAASPLTFDGAETVLFNQSFVGLKSAADAPDFTFTKGKGTGWEFYDYFTMSAGSNNTASVTTKNSYDLRGAAGFELEVKVESTSGKMEIDMPGGYQFAYSNNKGAWAATTGSNYIALLKDGALLTPDEDGNTGYAYCYAYDYDTTYTIRYVNGVWTINAKTNTNENTGKDGVTFTYKDSSDVMSSFNGTFGIAANYTNKITLYNMKLTQIGDTATVNKWKYDKTFSSKDTIEGLRAEGYTFNNTDFTVTDNGIKATSKTRTVTFGPDGNDLSGNYYFETAIQRSTNGNYIGFNKSSNGYYRLKAYNANVVAEKNSPYVRLEKVVGSDIYVLQQLDYTNADSKSAPDTYTWKVKVITNDDGSVSITANGTSAESGEKFDLSYTDTATDVSVHSTGLTEDNNYTETLTNDVDNGAPLTSGKIVAYWSYCGTNSYLKYLNAYSILEATAGEPVTVTRNVIDKTFSSTDTKESIATEGFTTSSTSGVTLSFADNYLKFSGKTNTLIYTNADAIKGTYSLSTSFKHSNNYARVYFNYQDTNNHYVLRSNYYTTPKVLELVKVSGGKEYILGQVTGISANAAGRAKTSVDVNVTENTDGSLTIYTKWSNTGLTKEFTYTDTGMFDADGDDVKETNTGAPITSGAIRVYQSYSASYVYNFKLTTYNTEMQGGTSEVPEYSAVFYGDSGVIKELSSGNIYFEYPVSRIGTYTAVATLHNGNEMTGLKVLSPLELYAGKIWLFNVADASDAKVRVYFFDAGDTLNRLTEVYELN